MLTGMALVDAIRAEQSDPPSGIHTLGVDQTHHWIRDLEPGRVTMVWPVDDLHSNLEGAVICSWLIALADQALFFAGTSICRSGEVTRMDSLNAEMLASVTDGDLVIEGSITRRVGDTMYGDCSFAVDSEVAARVRGTMSVVSADA